MISKGSLLINTSKRVGCALSLSVVGFWACSESWAHDPGEMSPRDFAVLKALNDAQTELDRVVSSPSLPDETKGVARSYVASLLTWKTGQLTVCFWQQSNESDDQVIREIMKDAQVWTKSANVAFNYLDDKGYIRRCSDHGTADIRATIHTLIPEFYDPQDPVGSDWARYGKLADSDPARVSMSLTKANFAYWGNDMISFNFNAVHEFGHALGLIHEHQQVDCRAWLADDSTVMRAYGWNNKAALDEFKNNLVQIPSSDKDLRPTSRTGFDAGSIMMYNFPPSIWQVLPGKMNPCLRPKPIEVPDRDDLDTISGIYGARAIAVAVSSQPPAQTPPLISGLSHDQLGDKLVNTAQARLSEVTKELEADIQRGKTSPAIGALVFGIPSTTTDEPKLRALAAPKIELAKKDIDAIQKLIAATNRAAAIAAQ